MAAIFTHTAVRTWNIALRTRCTLSLRRQVSHPHKTARKFNFICVSTFLHGARTFQNSDTVRHLPLRNTDDCSGVNSKQWCTFRKVCTPLLAGGVSTNRIITSILINSKWNERVSGTGRQSKLKVQNGNLNDGQSPVVETIIYFDLINVFWQISIDLSFRVEVDYRSTSFGFPSASARSRECYLGKRP
jgi:hypothetical protein